jgi:hypothetical protein
MHESSSREGAISRGEEETSGAPRDLMDLKGEGKLEEGSILRQGPLSIEEHSGSQREGAQREQGSSEGAPREGARKELGRAHWSVKEHSGSRLGGRGLEDWEGGSLREGVGNCRKGKKGEASGSRGGQ